eukprot:TRINITY_DN221_c0_g1_i1.p1 TRINITY_DN221_c0_g1~~TRINITY_DN221_c0_g1_i1.p1  ORF type:complete len:397 (-),score=137.02 TRINITY_DN221_c0_g1_i1:768-1958(-)
MATLERSLLESWEVMNFEDKKQSFLSSLKDQIGKADTDVDNNDTIFKKITTERWTKDFAGILVDEEDQVRIEANQTARQLLLKLLKISTHHDITLHLQTLQDSLYDNFHLPNRRTFVSFLLCELIHDLAAISRNRTATQAIRDTSKTASEAIIDFWIPRLIGTFSEESIVDCLVIINKMASSLSMILKQKHPNIYYVGDYFCTGIELGSGSFASVYLGRHKKTAKIVAIKVINWETLLKSKPNEKVEEQIQQEIFIQNKLDDDNIVRLFDIVKSAHLLFMVMEFCDCGTLEEYLSRNKTVKEDDVRHFMTQIALGLRYLRNNRILHRDLKPANILLDSNRSNPDSKGRPHAKIADFTFAKFVKPGDVIYTLCGSPMFMVYPRLSIPCRCHSGLKSL